MKRLPTKVPRDWHEAHSFFTARKYKTRDYRALECVGTEVHRLGDDVDRPVYSVRLYYTDIITYYPNGDVDLHPYVSDTTNRRREEAGMPTIRSATAIGVSKGKANRLKHSYRWWGVHAPHGERFPYGLPAVDIRLDANRRVTHVEGRPAHTSTEAVRMPILEAQKERNTVLRRTRKLIAPWAQAVDALNADQLGLWTFAVADLEELVEQARNGAGKDKAVAQFVQKFCAPPPYNTYAPASVTSALNERLKDLTPARNTHDQKLWRTEYVLSTKLKEVL